MSCSVSQVGPVGNAIAVLARVHGLNQSNITQASVLSISRTIYLKSTGAIVEGPTTLSKTTVVSDTLLTTYGWSADATGWNFKDEINGTLLTTAGALSIVYTLFDTTVTDPVGGIKTVMTFGYVAKAQTG